MDLRWDLHRFHLGRLTTLWDFDTSLILGIVLFMLGLIIKNTVDTAKTRTKVDSLSARYAELRNTMDAAAFRR